MADLTSGLTTRVDTSIAPPQLRIDGLDWTSPFRATAIHVGDVILAVNGAAVDAGVTGGAASQLIGQYAETSGFEKSGLKAGNALELTVRRRAFPQGWQDSATAAPLAERIAWRDEDNRPILGPGGPDAMTSDGFSESWGGWAEPFQHKIAYLLDRDQHSSTYVSYFEARDLAERHGPRVAFAVKHYPGRWSAAVKADYDRALSLAKGEAVTLPPGALDYRRRGEELAGQVRALAEVGWAAAQAAVETIAPFPAPNPAWDDIAPVKGKAVLLPPIGNDGYVRDGGRTWFATTQPDGDGSAGWYFVDAESETVRALLEAQRRYMQLVDPNLPARWEFLCRLEGEARLGVVGERAYYGLVARPIAALIGGAMFVDLAQRSGTQVPFAGEAGLLDDTPDLPPADATPAQILVALVGAVKTGDLALWRALHADWAVERRDDGDLIVHPHTLPPDDNRFEDSKRSMMGRVLDARPEWTGDPVTVLDGSRFPGALRIEEMAAWMSHIGSFDGETRTFKDVTVSKRWTLARLNGGPWRIAEAQSI